MKEFMVRKFRRFNNPNFIRRWDRIANNLLALVAVATLGLVFYLVTQQQRTLDEIERLALANEKAIDHIAANSDEQHEHLFDQVACIAEVAVIAGKGNDVTIENIDDCKYSIKPKAEEQAQIIIKETIRTHTETIVEPVPEQPGKGKKK